MACAWETHNWLAYSLLEDWEGNIWVAPGRMAPALLATRQPPFKKLPKVPGSTIEPFVGALYEDHQRNLWIGTPEALIRSDYTTGRITTFHTGGPEVGADVISICEDGSGNLWVGSYSHGLHRFDRRTGKFIKTYQHNPADPHSLSNDVVMRLFVDHNGILWAGTADGLDRFDALAERFTTYKFEPQSSLLILALIEDQQGKLWIGTESSGLRQFDPATGQLSIYQHDRDRPGTLSDNRVNSVHFDRSGTMWVGTQNGLDRFDAHTGRFSALIQRDGLPGNAVGCILEDKAGSLWMSTNNGVARFNPQSGTFTNFSTAEGLPGPNLTGWGACFQSPSGEMFFGGFNGGTSFFPEAVAGPSSAPRIVRCPYLCQSGDQSLSLQARGLGARLERSGKRPEAGYLHDPTFTHVHVSRTGSDQGWALERARCGASHRDPAVLVEYKAVPGRRWRPSVSDNVGRIPSAPESCGLSIRDEACGAHAHCP